MAQITSVVTTSQIVNSQARHVRDVSNEIYMLYPNVGTLLTFLADPKFKRKEPTDQAKFEWFEDDMTARWAVGGATTVTNESTATTLNVTDGTLWAAGDLGYIPQLISGSTPGEIFRVVSVSSNNLVTVRGINSVLMTMNAAAPIAILGPAMEEGSARPNPKQTIPTAKFGYTQNFRDSFSFSRTQMKSKTYGAPGGEFERIKMKRFQEHKRGINRAFLWGAATQDYTGGPTGQPLRTSAGVNSVVTTNVVDGGTTLTKSKWDEFLRTAFAYGDADMKILVASPLVLGALNSWSETALQIRPGEKTGGLAINRYESPHGTLAILRDQMLENPSGSTAGFGSWAFVLNPEDIKVRVITDTQYIEYPIETNGGADTMIGEYLSEMGLQVINEKHHAKLYNVVAAA